MEAKDLVKEVGEIITSVCKKIKEVDVYPGEDSKIVKALASLGEARAMMLF